MNRTLGLALLVEGILGFGFALYLLYFGEPIECAGTICIGGPLWAIVVSVITVFILFLTLIVAKIGEKMRKNKSSE